MNFLFRKKQSVQAPAELLEDGRERMNEEMKKPKYNNYAGREVFIDVACASSLRTSRHSKRR